MGLVLDQNQDPTITHNINIGDSSSFKACIRYTCGTTGKLYSVASKFFKQGTGLQADLVYTLQTDNGGSPGIPSGTILETITVPQATINGWTNDTFNQVLAAGTTDVTSGTTYWLVVDSSASDASNWQYFRYRASATAGWDGVRDYGSGAWHTTGYTDSQAPNQIYVQTPYTSTMLSLF